MQNQIKQVTIKSEKKLKIAITQFQGTNETALCKLSITLAGQKTKHFQIEITEKEYLLDEKGFQFCLANWLTSQIGFVYKKAKLQLNSEYGISTYWIFHNDK